MRGRTDAQALFCYTIDVESRIRSDHPLRALKERIDGVLKDLDAMFAQAYSQRGRPGVPPERLLKALPLMTLYSIRSERQLGEPLDLDLMFRWFVDLSPDEPTLDATAFGQPRRAPRA